MLRQSLIFAAVLAACSGSVDVTDLEVDSPREQPSELTDGEAPWGEPWAIDDDAVDQVDKTSVIMLHGWAVAGQLEPRGGELHYEPIDQNYADFFEFAWNVLGRCGRLDGTGMVGSQSDFQPCVVPWGRSGQKIMSWRVDWSGCPLDTTVRANLLQGFRQGFLAAQFESGWLFPEAAAAQTPNIKIRCTTLAETNALNESGGIAAGFPVGPITFRHAADFAGFDVCEQPGSTGAKFYALTDEYWTYGKAEILINWFGMLQWLHANCTQMVTDPVGMRVKTGMRLAMHELGHILGFQHQSDTVSTNPENIMHKTRTCQSFYGTPPRFRPLMREAMWLYDLPHNEVGLQIHDTDLSCYSPL